MSGSRLAPAVLASLDLPMPSSSPAHPSSARRVALRLLTIVLVFGPALCGVLVLGCQGAGGPPDAPDAGKEAEQTVPVEVARARVDPIEQTLLSTATVEARRQASLAAEVTGTVVEVLVEEGDVVAAGAPLAKLRNPELKIAASSAASQVTRLRQELAKLEPLVGKGFVPRQTVEELQAQLTQARDQQARVAHQLGQLEPKAPVSGLVARRNIHPGQQVTIGMEMFRVVDPGELQVVVHVPERSLGRIREGAAARVVSDALPGAVFDGHLRLIAPTVDPQTGTIRVTITVSERPRAATTDPAVKLRPGMFVNVHIVTDRHEAATWVPRRAIVYEENQPLLYTIERVEGRPTVARKLPVELGYGDAERIEIVRGIGADQEVIVLGQSGLKDETPVEVVEGRLP